MGRCEEAMRAMTGPTAYEGLSIYERTSLSARGLLGESSWQMSQMNESQRPDNVSC